LSPDADPAAVRTFAWLAVSFSGWIKPTESCSRSTCGCHAHPDFGRLISSFTQEGIDNRRHRAVEAADTSNRRSQDWTKKGAASAPLFL